MNKFPFVLASFPDPKMAKEAIVERLRRHQRIMIARKSGEQPPLKDDGNIDEAAWSKRLAGLALEWDCGKRIERRARAISARHDETHGLSHLKSTDRDGLTALRDGVKLVAIASEHKADELAAALHEEFPWMGPATEAVWHGMRNSVRRSDPGLRLPPMLLDGPPGVGKTAWARHLGELLGTEHAVVDATNENASFGLVGCQRGWSSSAPGRLLNTILSHRIANPVLVIDEVEKAGRASSDKGVPYGLAEALLPLLEPGSARAWSCPYYQVRFDLSYVIWVLTSNDFKMLPEPLLSRCSPIRLRALSQSELVNFARRQGLRKGLSETSVDAITDALQTSTAKTAVSLRTVMRMIDRGTALEGRGCQLH